MANHGYRVARTLALLTVIAIAMWSLMCIIGLAIANIIGGMLHG